MFFVDTQPYLNKDKLSPFKDFCPSIFLLLSHFFPLHPNQVSLQFGLAWRRAQSLWAKVLQMRLSWQWRTSKFWHFLFLLLYFLVIGFLQLILFSSYFWSRLVPSNTVELFWIRKTSLAVSYGATFLLVHWETDLLSHLLPIYFRFKGLESLFKMSRNIWLHGGRKDKDLWTNSWPCSTLSCTLFY